MNGVLVRTVCLRQEYLSSEFLSSLNTFKIWIPLVLKYLSSYKYRTLKLDVFMEKDFSSSSCCTSMGLGAAGGSQVGSMRITLPCKRSVPMQVWEVLCRNHRGLSSVAMGLLALASRLPLC